MSTVAVSREDLMALREKYRRLVDLRRSRDAAEKAGLKAFPSEVRAVRRAALRALAAEFPGALRELDVLTAARLRERLGEVERALSGGPVPEWLRACSLLHALLRERLRTGRGSLKAIWSAVADHMAMTPGEAQRLVYS
jgi:hypothetical protein